MEQSETIGKISEALSKAQGSIKHATFDSTNPHFKSKYASLSAVMDSCKQPLSDNGIAIIQGASVVEKRLLISTMLAHTSGEWIRDSLSIALEKDTAQGIGSAITYGRRYALSAIVGIVADEDDDGNAASTRQNARNAKTETKPKPQVEEKPKPLTGVSAAEDVKKIRELAQQYGCKTSAEFSILVEQVTGAKVNSASGLSSAERKQMIDHLSAAIGNIGGENEKES